EGSWRARWNTPGRVVVRAPPGAAIMLESTLGPARALGSGTVDVCLPTGSYVVVIATPGRVKVRVPILLERGGEVTVTVGTPPRVDDVPPGFVYIPAGAFL